MNIAMSFTSNWSKYASVVIYSLLKNNPDVGCIYIFTDEPVSFSGVTCKVVYNTYKQVLSRLSNLNKLTDFSEATLLRLFLHEVVPVDKILYIDCDLIVDKNISLLYSINIENKVAALVREIEDKYYSGYNQEGEVLNDYFNAGVMLLNLKRVRELNKSSEIIRLLNTYSYFLPDQDVFNVIYKDEIVEMDEKYNYHDFSKKVDDVHIYHWAGLRKDPWIYGSPYSDVWLKYESECTIASIAQ